MKKQIKIEKINGTLKKEEGRKKQERYDQKNIKREMERIEIRQKEKAKEESTGMENEGKERGKEKKSKAGIV